MFRTLVCSAAALLMAAGAALAQSNGGRQVEATVKLVDADRGVALITVMQDNGIRIFEVAIPPTVKFQTPRGKKIKEGLRSNLFWSPNNRPAVPITIQYGNVNGAEQIKKIIVR
jgi:hypothetical protein